MIKTNAFITIFCLFYLPIYGQHTLSGIITNQKGTPLPFVNILINNSQKDGVSTDINGKFIIQHKNRIEQLTITYIGYENLVLNAPFKQPLSIQLKGTAYEFEEVTVVAGENPAHRIIRKVVKNRDLNAPEKMDSYTCRMYNKMAAGYILETEKMKAHYIEKDTSKKMIKKLYNYYSKSHETFSDREFMLIESASRRSFRQSHDLREEVLLNRISGTKKLPLVAIATEAQPFSFYQEEVVIFDQSFLNPISKNSTKKYFFNLTDTLYQQQDTVFIISFQPKKGKNFNGLEGILYINTNQYAIQNVIAKPDKKEHLIDFEITQKYQWVNNEHWFPEQLLFEMETEAVGISFVGMKIYGRTYVDEVSLNPPLDKKLFKQGEEVVVSEDVYSRDDSLWQLYRREALTTKEARTYEIVDSIFEEKNLDKWFTLIEFLGKERIKIGPVDMDIGKLINGNPSEGLKLGLGLATNESFSKHIEVGGYGIYGFSDKRWKYGGHFGIFFDKYRDNRLDFVYRNDLHTPAEPKFIQRGDFISFGQFANIRDAIISKSIRLQSYPIKYLRFNAKLSQQALQPLYDYQFAREATTLPYNFTELNIGFRYAFNEKFIRFFGRRFNNDSQFPILELQYTKGFDGFLKGQWEYSKLLFSLSHTFRRKALGETEYRIEAGYINNVIPYTKLFSSFGLGAGYRGFTLGISQGFQTMEFYEFISDRFVHLFFRHDFGTLLLKSKKFKPNIVIEHNLAFGSLQNPEVHQDITFKTLEKGYFEGGLIIENLLRIQYLKIAYIGLGAGMFYRYGPNQNEAFKDNVAWGLKLSLSY